MRRRGSRFDPNLTREAIRGPGLDTRSWGQLARVDDDDDAVVWDEQLGWLCDVTFIGGSLDGDGPILARLPSRGQGDSVGSHRAPRRGGLVVTVLPTADPNDAVIIVGQIHNEDETAPALAPTTVNGDTIVERDAASGQVAAIDTWLEVFPGEDIDWEFRNVRITGSLVLGAPDADQPFVRGDDLKSATDDFADAISQFAQDIAASVPAPPNSALTVADAIAATAPLIAAAETFKTAIEACLSTIIKGD